MLRVSIQGGITDADTKVSVCVYMCESLVHVSMCGPVSVCMRVCLCVSACACVHSIPVCKRAHSCLDSHHFDLQNLHSPFYAVWSTLRLLLHSYEIRHAFTLKPLYYILKC